MIPITADGKVRRWVFWLLAVAIALQFYFVQQLLAAFAIFAIGFGVLAFVVLTLYALQKGWEIAVARILGGEPWIRAGRPGRNALAGWTGAGRVKVDAEVENGKEELERLVR